VADNLTEDELIEDGIIRYIDDKLLVGEPEDLAQCIADLAYNLSKENFYESPYYKRMKEKGIKVPMEGREDEICVVCA
jgi:hypothetical protein